MTDNYEGHQTSLSSPGIDANPIVPNDSAPLSHVSRALYVGVAGDVRVEMQSGAQAVFQSMQPGMFYPLRVRKVFASGTTAAGLVAVF